MGKIIAIANQKGGVGKTTTSISLAGAFAKLEKNVLIIDFDPQGNSSIGLGIEPTNINKTIYSAITGIHDINKTIKKTCLKHLDIIPANITLASFEAGINSNSYPQYILKNVLNKLNQEYDYIIIDCPPSLGLLSINALVAADTVLIPVQCEYFALDAVAKILASVKKIQMMYNNSLQIEGFLLTMYDSRLRVCVEIGTEIRSLFKEKTFQTTVPRNVSIIEAQAKGIPLVVFRPTSQGSQAYLQLAKEIFDNENLKEKYE